ncbi:MAG: CarD family transcriptional regulator [Deltaproteobacteria bacterium]|nr:CarD family transcriptional regulator [Deltaproteobacteria bacterium]
MARASTTSPAAATERRTRKGAAAAEPAARAKKPKAKKPAKKAAQDDLPFSVGDKAVYPAQGVSEVVEIAEKEISGTIIRFFVLKILDTEMKIMVPVFKATQVGLRPLASDKDIKSVMKIIKDKSASMDKQTWNRRYRGFMEKIKTGSLFDVAEVYRDLSRLKNTKVLSFGEKRMLDTARNLIVKELSVAQNKVADRVEQQLEKLFA